MADPTQLDPIIVTPDAQPAQGGQLTLAPPDEGAETEGLSLAPDPVVPAKPPSVDIAKKRSDKIQYGLGNVLKKSPEDIYTEVSNGNEDSLRQEAASNMDFSNAMKKQQDLLDLANQPGPMDSAKAGKILDASAAAQQTIDPYDVVEKAYAHKYLSVADTAAQYMENTVLDSARKEIPQQAEQVQNKADTLISKMELAKTLQDNLETQISEQGWVPWLADQAKTLFQPYNEYKMRGNVAGAGGLLLGDALKDQADKLFMLPYDQYKSGLTTIVQNLQKDNPTLAKEFVDYVVGVSDSDRLLNNTFTMLTPLDYGEGLKLGRTALRKVELYNRTNKAFSDIVKSVAEADKDIPVRAVANEGAGNVGEAGIIRASDNITKSLNGTLDPVKDTKDKLMTFFKQDAQKLADNPGSLSREQMTRLQDGFYKTSDNLWQTTIDSARVNRTPLPVATEDAMRAYREVVQRDFPGLDNAITDVGNPRLDPVSNTYHVDITFSNQGGDLFSSAETAQNFAKMHGFDGVQIVPAEGSVRVEEAKLAGGKRDLTRKPQLEKELSDLPETIKKTKAKSVDETLPDDIRAKAKDDLKFFRDTQKRYSEELKAIGTRITEIPARIEQHGLGYKFVITKPYRETEDVVRNFLINDKQGNIVPSARSTGSATGFDSWKNAALGWLRGADDTLSYNETLQRKIATYTQSAFQKWAKEEAEKIEQVATGTIRRDDTTGEPINWFKAKTQSFLGKIKQREVFQQFNEVLDYARKATDPDTGELGYFFKTPGELEDHYQRFYKRMPSYPEVEGYFAHVKLTEGNRVFSEIAEYRNRARLGVEQHQVSFLEGKDRVSSSFFDGIAMKEFPGGEDQILIMGSRKGDEKLYNLGSQSLASKLGEYKEMVQEGRAKIIRIYDPDAHPLDDFSDIAKDQRVRYIMTSDTESKPLDYNHVNRRGGGHFEYDYDHYIKQAKVKPQTGGAAGSDKRTVLKNIYVGDTTVMPVDNRALGRNLAKHFDEVRMLMRDNKLEEAQAYATRNLGIEWKEIQGWFKATRDPKGNIIPPRLALNEPFYVVPRNKKIYDLDKSLENRYGDTFKDGTKSGSDAQQFQVAYNLPRDSNQLRTLQDIGTQGNPLYNWQPAKLVDPIPTMNRSLNRAIQSTFMDDYKIFAVEQWLREAAPYLKASESELRSAPFWHFNNPDFKSGADKAAVWNLKSNQFKINQFVGMPNTFDTWVHGLTQHLVDTFYEKFGPKEGRSLGAKALTVIPLALLSRVHDPIQFIRSVTFNAKLGLFAFPQMIVQAQNHATILALEPRRGTAGLYASLLHQWSRLNNSPEVLKSLDEYATKLNFLGSKWKLGEWNEARQELSKVGFEHVQGEYILADDALNYKFIKNDFGNFLDAGQVFFREGEKSSRLTAWYTAFRQFRDENPTGAITTADRATILNKADLLTTNMSRASASNLHGGVFSLSTQFLAYQLRLAELFFGKRIGDTVGERMAARARMVTFYAALYGAPSAIGLSGLPMGDSIRQYALNKGYVVGDNFLNTLTMEGAPAMALAAITGKGDPQKGNFYNVGNRYGVQGFTQIREALTSDASWWKLVGGAGISTFSNTLTSMDPFWKAGLSMISPQETGSSFPLKSSDFFNLFNEISSASAAKKLIMAMNTGRWISKNEAYVSDTSKANAVFQTLTGLQPQGQDDIFAKSSIKKEEEELWKSSMKEIIKDYRRGLDAVRDNNPELARDMFTRVRTRFELTGYPMEKRAQVMAIASKGYESQITSSNFDFATKQPPAGQEATRLDALTRQLKLDQKRNQP